jgi:hypothetical protein
LGEHDYYYYIGYEAGRVRRQVLEDSPQPVDNVVVIDFSIGHL